MDVYWLEQSEADVPKEDDWLSAKEQLRLERMRIPKRRSEWRLGRWTAKCALATYLNMESHREDLAGIEVRSAPCGAPEVFLANEPAAITISLSHRAGLAVCAVANSGAALGCDVELIESRSMAFVSDYFTAEEQALVAWASATERWWILALLWSAKESALKALRAGLTLDTRHVIVGGFDAVRRHIEDAARRIGAAAIHFKQSEVIHSWRPLQVRYTEGEVFHGWWQKTDSLVRTVVAAPPPKPPILLTMRPYGVNRQSLGEVSPITEGTEASRIAS